MSSATIGAGFSSVDSIVGMAEVKMGNFDLFNPPTFTGAGQKLQLIASLVRSTRITKLTSSTFLPGPEASPGRGPLPPGGGLRQLEQHLQ